MKALQWSSLIIVLSLFMLGNSCKKDKNAENVIPSGSGTINYNGEDYPVRYGCFEDYGNYDGIHYYQLYLFSEGVDIENETGFGNVAAVYFSTYSPPIPSGTIPYYSESVDPVPTVEAEVVLDYDLNSEEGIRINSFEDGEMTISLSPGSETYEIEFSFTAFDGSNLTGQFTGEIIEL